MDYKPVSRMRDICLCYLHHCFPFASAFTSIRLLLFSHLYEWNDMVCLRLPRFSSSYCSSCPCGRPRCSGAITTRSYRQRRTGSWGRTTCGPQRLRGQRLAAHLTLVPWNFTRRRCQMSSETGLCPPGDSCKQQPEHILTRSIWSKWCFRGYLSPF